MKLSGRALRKGRNDMAIVKLRRQDNDLALLINTSMITWATKNKDGFTRISFPSENDCWDVKESVARIEELILLADVLQAKGKNDNG